MNPLIRALKKYGYIPPAIEMELESHIQTIHRKKNDYFLKKGQVASSLFIIEHGLVRSFYEENGKEINLWFGFEGIISGSILPLFYERPSIENIQFLEDTTLHYIPIHKLNALYATSNEMNTIGRKIAENYACMLEERACQLQTYSAEQRYRALLAENSNILQRVSLGMIASYLGISQETVSRIRKK